MPKRERISGGQAGVKDRRPNGSPHTSLHQGFFDALYQSLGVEGLRQETSSTATYCKGPLSFAGESRDENHWRGVALLLQTLLELDAAHTGHSHIGNEASRLIQILRPKKLLGGPKGMD